MNLAALTRAAADSTEFQEWRRRAFPFFRRKTFLTHASVSPLPQCSAQALIEYSQRLATDGQFDASHDAIYHRCKERLAQLIGSGATPDEIAFAGSTSHALGIVATAIDWQPGDNCVVADGDFPANVVTWKNLRHTHGVEVRMIPHRPAMDITLDDVVPLVDEHTRIVSLASANFLSGYPIDLAKIGAWLRERNIFFCVDAIQTLGAIEIDARYVDFICADAHKWLLGPNGIAVLWARRAALDQLRPMILGWLASQDRDNWFAYDTTPIASAERFEPGARNYLGIVGMETSLQLLEESGPELVASRVVQLRNFTAQQLQSCGCRLLWEPDPDLRAGIVSFQPPSGETAVLYEALEENFALSLRQDKNGAPWIRVSPHFMNTEADIERLAAAIKSNL